MSEINITKYNPIDLYKIIEKKYTLVIERVGIDNEGKTFSETTNITTDTDNIDEFNEDNADITLNGVANSLNFGECRSPEDVHTLVYDTMDKLRASDISPPCPEDFSDEEKIAYENDKNINNALFETIQKRDHVINDDKYSGSYRQFTAPFKDQEIDSKETLVVANGEQSFSLQNDGAIIPLENNPENAQGIPKALADALSLSTDKEIIEKHQGINKGRNTSFETKITLNKDIVR